MKENFEDVETKTPKIKNKEFPFSGKLFQHNSAHLKK